MRLRKILAEEKLSSPKKAKFGPMMFSREGVRLNAWTDLEEGDIAMEFPGGKTVQFGSLDEALDFVGQLKRFLDQAERAFTSEKGKKASSDEEKTFVSSVMKDLKSFVSRTRKDIEKWAEEDGYDAYDPVVSPDTAEIIAGFFRKGMTEADALKMLTLSEDFDPRISEDDALRRMKAIEKKYMKSASWMSELHLLLTDAQEERGNKPLTVTWLKTWIKKQPDQGELEKRALKWLDQANDGELKSFLDG